MTKIGVFGGTFDPPHNGHLILASEAVHQFDIDKVLFILSPNPPHKRNNEITSLPHRLNMLSLALEGNDIFEISEIDINRPGPHFAVDTMKILHNTYPNSHFTYLMGKDSLRDLPTWGRPTEFLSYCDNLGVMSRENSDEDFSSLYSHFPNISNKLNWLDTPNFDISSRDIRKRIRNNIPVKYYLSLKVHQYILENNLFT
jgi:nicotinate-nucleotide adenylyltransferase